MTQSSKSSPVTDCLLTKDEPAAFECIRFGDKPIVISCDHASNRIPEKLDNLGLSHDELERHIAWDIGAAEVAKLLAENLQATLVSNNYSRLVVDCNRYLSDLSAFTTISDTTTVIGNQDLSELDKAQRAESIYYVWDKDPRIPLELLAALRSEQALVVGDNEPYSGRDLADYTVDHHAEKHGFAHTSIEIRQDLLQDQEGILEWSSRLSEIFKSMLNKPEFYQALKYS